MLVMTRGPEGCDVIHCGKRRYVAAVSVDQVNPTGAGDVFAAAFMLPGVNTGIQLLTGGTLLKMLSQGRRLGVVHVADMEPREVVTCNAVWHGSAWQSDIPDRNHRGTWYTISQSELDSMIRPTRGFIRGYSRSRIESISRAAWSTRITSIPSCGTIPLETVA